MESKKMITCRLLELTDYGLNPLSYYQFKPDNRWLKPTARGIYSYLSVSAGLVPAAFIDW